MTWGKVIDAAVASQPPFPLQWTLPLWAALESADIPVDGLPAILEMTYTPLHPLSRRSQPPEKWLACDWKNPVKHAVGVALGVRVPYEGSLAQHSPQWGDLVTGGMEIFGMSLRAATAAFGEKRENAWVFPQDPRWQGLKEALIESQNPLRFCTSEFMRMPDPVVLAPALELHEKYKAASAAVTAASAGLFPGQSDYVQQIASSGIGTGLLAPLERHLRQPGPPSSGLAFWGDGA